MKHIFDTIRRFFKRKRRIPFKEIERCLPEEALAALKIESQFLRDAHGVAVYSLAEGESAGKPRAVDAAVEARLTAQMEQPQTSAELQKASTRG